jgi:hypothetical protein
MAILAGVINVILKITIEVRPLIDDLDSPLAEITIMSENNQVICFASASGNTPSNAEKNAMLLLGGLYVDMLNSGLRK